METQNPKEDAEAPENAPARSSGWTLLILYVAAILLGVANGLWGSELGRTSADFISTLFIRIFKFVSVPIIAVSIISTLAGISRSGNSGKIFRHTIFYTLFTTILAAALAALLYELFTPENVSVAASAAAPLSSVANAGGEGYLKYVESVIPDNILAPFLSANVLSVLLISAAVGIAIARIPASRSQEVLLAFFSGLQEVLFKIVSWVIKALPIGIFGFTSVLASDLSSGIELGGLGTYFMVVLGANVIQMAVVLPLVLLARGLNPIHGAGAYRRILLQVLRGHAPRHDGERREPPRHSPSRLALRASHLHDHQHERVRSLHPAYRRLSHAECRRRHHVRHACRLGADFDDCRRGQRRRPDGLLLSLRLASREHECAHSPDGRHSALLRRDRRR